MALWNWEPLQAKYDLGCLLTDKADGAWKVFCRVGGRARPDSVLASWHHTTGFHVTGTPSQDPGGPAIPAPAARRSPLSRSHGQNHETEDVPLADGPDGWLQTKSCSQSCA